MEKKIYVKREIFENLIEIIKRSSKKIEMETPLLLKLEKIKNDIYLVSFSIIYTKENRKDCIPISVFEDYLENAENLIPTHTHPNGKGVIRIFSEDNKKFVIYNPKDMIASKILGKIGVLYKENSKIKLDIVENGKIERYEILLPS